MSLRVSEFLQYAAGTLALIAPIVAGFDPLILTGYYWLVFITAATFNARVWRQ